MRLSHPLRRLQCPRDTAMFSGCFISSAPVRLQTHSLRLARPVILRAFLLRRTLLRSLWARPPSFTGSQSCARSIMLVFVRLRRLARRRDRGCCSDPAIESSISMNPFIARLVGALSNRRSLNFCFEEAARVESLCNGMLAAQSSGICFFSASMCRRSLVPW